MELKVPTSQTLVLICSKIFLAVCWMGCTIQMLIVTEEFFRFDVNTKLEIFFPEKLESPAVSVCFPYVDVMDLDQFNNKYSKSFRRPLTDDDKSEISSLVTLGDVFNLTTRFHELIESCVIRIPGFRFGSQFGNSTICHKVFESRRFRIGEFLCTMFITKYLPMYRDDRQMHVLDRKKNKKTKELITDHDSLNIDFNDTKWVFDMKAISYDLSFASTFYRIDVKVTSPGIKDTRLTRMILHSPTGLPYVSYSLSPLKWRQYSMFSGFKTVIRKRKNNNKKTREVNRFTLSFSRVTGKKLPYPYASKCRNDYSQNTCLVQCTRRSCSREFGKHPFQTMSEEEYISKVPRLANMRLISDRDLRNESFVEGLRALESKCLSKCADPSCDSDYTITSVQSAMGLDQSVTSYTIATPDDPYVSAVSTEKMRANDYFMLLFSLIGFWLGLSAQDLNFVPLVRRLLDHRKSANRCYETTGKQGTGWYCVRSRRLLNRCLEQETTRVWQAIVNDWRRVCQSSK